MNAIVIGILLGIASFFALQMVLPFPYGLVAWFIILWLIIRYAKKHTVIQKRLCVKLQAYRSNKRKRKKLQNDEALRILEKKYIEEKISKEEYLKRKKKEFLDIEYNPRKCKVCGSEEFEFISEKIGKLDEDTSDIGYYKCKKCGAK
ncbi:hypothetical protein YTPLAS73_05180 [Nitrosarchaeum sp.]|nr:hypothetical protein YTPLAS73_05180 [Nitrosarchaeum sp.]